MEIRTALEIIAEVMNIHLDPIKDDKSSISDATFEEIKKAINIARQEILDYASENVEADYTTVFDGIDRDSIEMYIPKGEFDKIKELIK